MNTTPAPAAGLPSIESLISGLRGYHLIYDASDGLADNRPDIKGRAWNHATRKHGRAVRQATRNTERSIKNQILNQKIVAEKPSPARIDVFSSLNGSRAIPTCGAKLRLGSLGTRLAPRTDGSETGRPRASLPFFP